MDCPTCEAMVDAYVDGELSARDSADFERALYASLDQGTVRTGRFVRDAAEVPQTT